MGFYGRMVKHTIQSSIIWLNVCLFHGAVLDDKSITLGAITAKDGRAVEREIKTLGEGQAGICQEADLKRSVSYQNQR